MLHQFQLSNSNRALQGLFDPLKLAQLSQQRNSVPEANFCNRPESTFKRPSLQLSYFKSLKEDELKQDRKVIKDDHAVDFALKLSPPLFSSSTCDESRDKALKLPKMEHHHPGHHDHADASTEHASPRSILKKKPLQISKHSKGIQKEKSLQCNICGQVFEKFQQLGGHTSKAHPHMSKNYQ